MGAGRAITCICLLLGAALAPGAKPDPGAGDADWERGLALEQEGRFTEAIRAYRSAADEGHAESPALTRIAACHQQLAERAATPAAERLDHRLSAAGALARAIRLDPANREALGRLGDLALEAGDPEGALAVYRNLEALAPDEPLTQLRLGRAHASLGDQERGLAEFRRASERVEATQARGPEAAALRELASLAHLAAAESLIALGRRELARHELDRVLAAGGSPESRPVIRARMLLGALDAEPAPAAPASPAPRTR